MNSEDRRCSFLLGAPNTSVFRISLRRGDVFRLRCFSEVPDEPEGWCAEVVELVSTPDPARHKFFYPGSGIDFSESDVLEVLEEATNSIKYRAPS